MAKFITSLPGVGGATAAILNKHGFRVVEDIANATPEALSAVPGFRASRAAKIIAAARAILAEEQAGKTPDVKKPTRTRPLAPGAESKAAMAEATAPKVKAPKSPKPPKVEAPVVVEVKEKPAKVAKVVVDDTPKVKPPKAPKAAKSEAAKPLVVEVKPAKSEKKAKAPKSKVKKVKEPVAVQVETKEKKVKSDKTEKAAGKGKKSQ